MGRGGATACPAPAFSIRVGSEPRAPSAPRPRGLDTGAWAGGGREQPGGGLLRQDDRGRRPAGHRSRRARGSGRASADARPCRPAAGGRDPDARPAERCIASDPGYRATAGRLRGPARSRRDASLLGAGPRAVRRLPRQASAGARPGVARAPSRRGSRVVLHALAIAFAVMAAALILAAIVGMVTGRPGDRAGLLTQAFGVLCFATVVR